MDAEMSAILRRPFEPEKISKRPQISCRKCSDAQSKVCSEHEKRDCGGCGQYITERHIHLDYVGHADVTGRLLEADPEWTWEPVALDQFNQPVITETVDGKNWRLWIYLTVGGVTRRGVGTVPREVRTNTPTAEVEKQLISDALRNAAMRFGVALDLWSKAERVTGGSGEVSQSAPVGVPVMIEVSDAETAEHPTPVAVEVSNAETAQVTDVPQEQKPVPVMFNDEPLPEYQVSGGIEPAIVRPEPAPQTSAGKASEGGFSIDDLDFNYDFEDDMPEYGGSKAAQTENPISRPREGDALITDAQKTAVASMLEQCGIVGEARKERMSRAAGRAVGSLGELTRTEAIALMQSLVSEKDAKQELGWLGPESELLETAAGDSGSN